jgi:hypothetical protein
MSVGVKTKRFATLQQGRKCPQRLKLPGLFALLLAPDVTILNTFHYNNEYFNKQTHTDTKILCIMVTDL